MRPIVGWMLAATLCVAGCLHSRQTTWKLTHQDDMKSVVAQHVPRGTSLAEAEAFMKREGFKCELKRDATFVASHPFSDDPRDQHEHIDFLLCERTQSGPQFMMGQLWSVALVVRDDKVEDVLVQYWLDGP